MPKVTLLLFALLGTTPALALGSGQHALIFRCQGGSCCFPIGKTDGAQAALSSCPRPAPIPCAVGVAQLAPVPCTAKLIGRPA